MTGKGKKPVVKRCPRKLAYLVPRHGRALLDPPDALEDRGDEAALEDFQMREGYEVHALVVGFLLSVALLAWVNPPRPEFIQTFQPRNPAAVVRLIYPLPEVKGKVWDPVLRPDPPWIRVGSAAPPPPIA